MKSRDVVISEKDWDEFIDDAFGEFVEAFPTKALLDKSPEGEKLRNAIKGLFLKNENGLRSKEDGN